MATTLETYQHVVRFEKALRKTRGAELQRHIGFFDLMSIQKEGLSLMNQPAETAHVPYMQLVERVLTLLAKRTSLDGFEALWPKTGDEMAHAAVLDSIGCPTLAKVVRDAASPRPPASGFDDLTP